MAVTGSTWPLRSLRMAVRGLRVAVRSLRMAVRGLRVAVRGIRPARFRENRLASVAHTGDSFT